MLAHLVVWILCILLLTGISLFSYRKEGFQTTVGSSYVLPAAATQAVTTSNFWSILESQKGSGTGAMAPSLLGSAGSKGSAGSAPSTISSLLSKVMNPGPTDIFSLTFSKYISMYALAKYNYDPVAARYALLNIYDQIQTELVTNVSDQTQNAAFTANPQYTSCNQLNTVAMSLYGQLVTVAGAQTDLSGTEMYAELIKAENQAFQTGAAGAICIGQGANLSTPCIALASQDDTIFPILQQYDAANTTLLTDGEYLQNTLNVVLQAYTGLGCTLPSTAGSGSSIGPSIQTVFTRSYLENIGIANSESLSNTLQQLSPYYVSRTAVSYISRQLIATTQFNTNLQTSSDYIMNMSKTTNSIVSLTTPLGPGQFYDESGSAGIRTCPSGFYCPVTGTNPIPCPVGFYCPPGTTTPIACPTGLYTAEGKSALSDCTTSYPEGYYPKNGIATQCPAGTYCPLNTTGARKCPAGTYNSGKGKTSLTDCKPCPAGSYCPTASAVATACPVGTYNGSPGGTSVSSCTTCPAGTYCSTKGLVSPTQCPTGTYSGATGLLTTCITGPPGQFSNTLGATDISAFSPCPIGTYCPGGTQPVRTVPGQYSDVTGLSSPKSCPPGTYGSTAGLTTAACSGPCAAGSFCPSGSITPTATQCPAGSYCPVGIPTPTPCPAGNYCPIGSASPTQCPAGTFTSLTGQTSQAACLPCTGGGYCPAGSAQPIPCTIGNFCPARSVSPTQCIAGSYCDTTGLAAAIPCPAGTYSTTLGATSMTSCLACAGGYFNSSPGQTACTPCMLVDRAYGIVRGAYCPPSNSYISYVQPSQLQGSALGSGTLLQIPVGSTNPILCPAGSYCPTIGTITPTPCPIGTASSLTGISNVAGCSGCPPGTYCPNTGMTTGLACPAGSYCPTLGTIIPTGCPAGTYSNQTGLSAVSQCTTCAAGAYCPGGGSSTVTCPPGTYCPSTGGSSATQCPIGGICPIGGATPPLSCPPGMLCSTAGLGSATTPCPVGTYSTGGAGTSCTRCPAGTYGSTTGLRTAACSGPCAGGYYCPVGSIGQYGNAATTALTSTTQCPAGTYCPPGSVAPIPCPVGSYCPTPGASTPSACPPGLYCASAGGSTGTQCPIGSICPVGGGGSSMLPCPAGMLCSTAGLGSATTPCPIGTYSTGGAGLSCTTCPAGTYGATTGLQTARCSGVCKAGYYCPAGSTSEYGNTGTLRTGFVTTPATNTLYNLSTICPVGHYCPTGSGAPVQCPAGTYGGTKGLTTPACGGQCEAGYYCAAGSTDKYGWLASAANRSYVETIQLPPEYSCPVTLVQVSIDPFSGAAGGVTSTGQYWYTSGASTAMTQKTLNISVGLSWVSLSNGAAFAVGTDKNIYYAANASSGTWTQVYTGANWKQVSYSMHTNTNSMPVLVALSTTGVMSYVFYTTALPPGSTKALTVNTGNANLSTVSVRWWQLGSIINPTTYVAAITSSTQTVTQLGNRYSTIGLHLDGTYSNVAALNVTDYTVDTTGTTQGYYYPAGTTAPVQCPAGTFGNGGIGIGGVHPTTAACSGQCSEGYYCPAGSVNSTAVPCPAGSYCPTGSAVPTLCPAGTYGNTTMLKTALCSGPCPAGTSCPPGTINATPGSCPAGYACPSLAGIVGSRPSTATTSSTGRFLRAPSGFIGWNPISTNNIHPVNGCAAGNCPGMVIGACGNFTNVTDAVFSTYTISSTPFTCSMLTAPVQCPAGTYSPAGAVTCLTTPAGSYSGVGASAAIPCPAGYYCPTTGTIPLGSSSSLVGPQPTPCPGGTYRGDTGRTAVTECLACSPQEYSQPGSSVCTRCPAGTWTDAGAAAGSTCQTCPAGKVLTIDSGNSNQIAFDALVAAVTPAALNTLIDAASRATTAAAQATASANISTNAPGVFALYGLPGYSLASCTGCAAGTFAGNNSGSTVGSGSSAITYPFPVGGTYPCPSCPPGTQSRAGATICTSTSCNQGEYVVGTACTTCPIGSYCDGLIATNCPPGYSSSAGSYQYTQCIPCPKNSFSVVNANQSPQCQPGQTLKPNTASTCIPTDTTVPGCFSCNGARNYIPPLSGYPGVSRDGKYYGHFTFGNGTARLESCTNCIGTFRDNPFCAPITSAMQCAAGTYSRSGYYNPLELLGAVNVTSDRYCTNCPAGQTSEAASQSCTTCPVGKVCRGVGVAAETCPAGQIPSSSTGGATSCVSCPAGKSSTPGDLTCTGCPAGTACPGGVASQTCPTGFASTAGATSCSRCPPGYTTPAAGAAACSPCPAGSICPGGAAAQSCIAGTVPNSSMTACVSCPAGSAAAAGATSCTQCAAGTYSVGGATSCTQCPAGRTSTQGASLCICPTGQILNSSMTACISSCPAGSVPNSSRTICMTCAAGTYAAAGATSCTPCAAGTYSDTEGQSSCKLCSPGRASNTVGATTCSDWYNSCDAGYFSGAGASSCSTCPAGSFSGFEAGSCILCPPNTFASSPGSSSCTSCSLNQFLNVLGSTTRCIQPVVPPGPRLPPGYAGTPIRQSCAQGEVKATPPDDPNGDPYCEQCPVGTYSSSDTTCSLCPAGYYNDETGQLTCKGCATGTYSAPGAETCSVCPAGGTPTRCPAGQSSVAGGACTNCPAGKSSVACGPCTTCPTGQSSVAGGPCTNPNCRAGQSGLAGAACTNCPAGQSSLAGGACTKCPAGQTSVAGGACTNCPAGTYNATAGSSSCTPCPAGTSSSITGATLCLPCGPGSSSSVQGATTCTPCTVGYYAVKGSTSCYYGNTSAIAPTCQLLGQYRPWNNGDCVDCQNGYYTTGLYQRGAAPCEPCPKGYYAPLPGSNSMCIACPLGKTTTDEVPIGIASCV